MQPMMHPMMPPMQQAQQQRSVTLGEKIKAMAAKVEKHPLIDKLSDGFVIYSQNYWKDFQLYYKNEHLVVSCFTVHREHHYTSNERFMVLVCSLCLAFGLAAHSTEWANAQCDQEPDTCDLYVILVFPLVILFIQTFLDSFARFFNTCGCVQSGVPKCVKDMFECIGKGFFFFLGVIAVVVCATGTAIVEQRNKRAGEEDSWAKVFVTFLATKLISAMISTSAMLLAKFHYSRSQQMKPPADVLATAAGKEQWDAKKTTCGRTSAKSDKWNKHLGADKTFEDLPLVPPDYDWSFDVCCCGTLYTYSAKNPDPEAGTTQPSQAVAGQQPPPQPQIQGQAPAASSSSSQQMPPGWKAVKDPATGKTYYQNDITKQTQWEKPSAQSGSNSQLPNPYPVSFSTKPPFSNLPNTMNMNSMMGGGVSASMGFAR